MPHLQCFSKHHLNQTAADFINTGCYSIGTKRFRRKFKKCGSIFNQSHLQLSTLYIHKYCVDQDTEVCELELESTLSNIRILFIYRSNVKNFNTFVIQVDKILQNMWIVKSNIVISGDLNVSCLQEGEKKSQLNALLYSYNLFSIVHSPTRIYRNSVSAINNIFIDTTKIDTYEVIAAINGLFDQDALIIKFKFKHFL